MFCSQHISLAPGYIEHEVWVVKSDNGLQVRFCDDCARHVKRSLGVVVRNLP